MRILISAGEASSDLYGAQLIVALRRRARAADEPLEFFGVGGENMRTAGCEIVVDARHLAVVGMTEILGQLPRIFGEFRKLMRAVDRATEKPAVAVVIDSPAFNFRVARELHQRGIPVIYFVAPQLWAWREYRVRRVQKWIKKVLCIFPFESDFYRKHGVEVDYVGHPLADLEEPKIARQEFAAKWGLDPAKQWVALLPGSRMKEVRSTLATLLQAADLLATRHRNLQFLLPVAASLEKQFMQAEIAKQPDLSRAAVPVLVEDSRAALHHARAAAVTSGTATVEAALMACPFVTVYRLSSLTYVAAKKLVKVPRVAMPNIIAGREVSPELLQDRFTPELVAAELERMLPDGDVRQTVLAGLEEVRGKLKPEIRSHLKGANAVERAADAVLRTLPQSGTR